jgi:hypothetical protein
MTQPLTSKKLWITGGLASLLLGTSWVGVAVKTQAQDQAQDQVGQEQATALEIVTKMTEAQRTYYQKNGKFQVVVQEMAEDLNLTLPPSFNYAVRTSFDGAYIYVQPAQTPMADQLKAYVGGAFIKSPQNEEQNEEIMTIICQTTKTGRRRPADPQVARGNKLSSTTELSLSCGDFSVPVPDSNQNE